MGSNLKSFLLYITIHDLKSVLFYIFEFYISFFHRHLHNAISATIHELYIHMDNATRFCAMVEVKQFKRDEQNGLNGNYISYFFPFKKLCPFQSKKLPTFLGRLQIFRFYPWWNVVKGNSSFLKFTLITSNLWILEKYSVFCLNHQDTFERS